MAATAATGSQSNDVTMRTSHKSDVAVLTVHLHKLEECRVPAPAPVPPYDENGVPSNAELYGEIFDCMDESSALPNAGDTAGSSNRQSFRVPTSLAPLTADSNMDVLPKHELIVYMRVQHRHLVENDGGGGTFDVTLQFQRNEGEAAPLSLRVTLDLLLPQMSDSQSVHPCRHACFTGSVTFVAFASLVALDLPPWACAALECTPASHYTLYGVLTVSEGEVGEKKRAPLGLKEGPAWKAYGAVGIENQGATCYLNALLQSMYHLPVLRRLLFDVPVAWEPRLGDDYSLGARALAVLRSPAGAAAPGPDVVVIDTDDDVAVQAEDAGVIAIRKDAAVKAALAECDANEALRELDAAGQPVDAAAVMHAVQSVLASMQACTAQSDASVGTKRKGKSLCSASTVALTQAFGWGPQDVRTQHDLNEMKVHLFDALAMYAKGAAPAHATALARLTEGRYAKTVTVPSRGIMRPPRMETFSDLQIPVEGFSHVMDSLRATRRTELVGADQYALEVEGSPMEKVDAVQETQYDRLPPILSLQLLRFTYDAVTHSRKKVSSMLEYPDVLDLSEFTVTAGPSEDCVMTSTAASTSGILGEVDAICDRPAVPCARYRLYSVLAHRGRAASGHYFAFIRRDFTEQLRAPRMVSVAGESSGCCMRSDVLDALASSTAGNYVCHEHTPSPDSAAECDGSYGWTLFDDEMVRPVTFAEVVANTFGATGSADAETAATAYCLWYVREDVLNLVLHATDAGAGVAPEQDVALSFPASRLAPLPRALHQRMSLGRLQDAVQAAEAKYLKLLERAAGVAWLHICTDYHLHADPAPRGPVRADAGTNATDFLSEDDLVTSFDVLRFARAIRARLPMRASMDSLWTIVSHALDLAPGSFRVYIAKRRDDGAVRPMELAPCCNPERWLPGISSVVTGAFKKKATQRLHECMNTFGDAPIFAPYSRSSLPYDALEWAADLPYARAPPAGLHLTGDVRQHHQVAGMRQVALSAGPAYEWFTELLRGGVDVEQAATHTWLGAPTPDPPADKAALHCLVYVQVLAGAGMVRDSLADDVVMDDAFDEPVTPPAYQFYLEPYQSVVDRNLMVWQRVLLAHMAPVDRRWADIAAHACASLMRGMPSKSVESSINSTLQLIAEHVDSRELRFIPVHVYLIAAEIEQHTAPQSMFQARTASSAGPFWFLATVMVPTNIKWGELRWMLAQWLSWVALEGVDGVDAQLEVNAWNRSVLSTERTAGTGHATRARGNPRVRAAHNHIVLQQLRGMGHPYGEHSCVRTIDASEDVRLACDRGASTTSDFLEFGSALFVSRPPSSQGLCNSNVVHWTASAIPRGSGMGAQPLGRSIGTSADDPIAVDLTHEFQSAAATPPFNMHSQGESMYALQQQVSQVPIDLHFMEGVPFCKDDTIIPTMAPTTAHMGFGTFWLRLARETHRLLHEFLSAHVAALYATPGYSGSKATESFQFLDDLKKHTLTGCFTCVKGFPCPSLLLPLRISVARSAGAGDVQRAAANALRSRVVHFVLSCQEWLIHSIGHRLPTTASLHAPRVIVTPAAPRGSTQRLLTSYPNALHDQLYSNPTDGVSTESEQGDSTDDDDYIELDLHQSQRGKRRRRGAGTRGGGAATRIVKRPRPDELDTSGQRSSAVGGTQHTPTSRHAVASAAAAALSADSHSSTNLLQSHIASLIAPYMFDVLVPTQSNIVSRVRSSDLVDTQLGAVGITPKLVQTPARDRRWVWEPMTMYISTHMTHMKESRKRMLVLARYPVKSAMRTFRSRYVTLDGVDGNTAAYSAIAGSLHSALRLLDDEYDEDSELDIRLCIQRVVMAASSAGVTVVSTPIASIDKSDTMWDVTSLLGTSSGLPTDDCSAYFRRLRDADTQGTVRSFVHADWGPRLNATHPGTYVIAVSDGAEEVAPTPAAASAGATLSTGQQSLFKYFQVQSARTSPMLAPPRVAPAAAPGARPPCASVHLLPYTITDSLFSVIRSARLMVGVQDDTENAIVEGVLHSSLVAGAHVTREQVAHALHMPAHSMLNGMPVCELVSDGTSTQEAAFSPVSCRTSGFAGSAVEDQLLSNSQDFAALPQETVLPYSPPSAPSDSMSSLWMLGGVSSITADAATDAAPRLLCVRDCISVARRCDTTPCASSVPLWSCARIPLLHLRNSVPPAEALHLAQAYHADALPVECTGLYNSGVMTQLQPWAQAIASLTTASPAAVFDHEVYSVVDDHEEGAVHESGAADVLAQLADSLLPVVEAPKPTAAPLKTAAAPERGVSIRKPKASHLIPSPE